MNYAVTLNGRDYDLPKYTLSVKEKADNINRFNVGNASDFDKFKKMHGFVVDCIGKENATEAFGGEDIKEMDLNAITVAYLRICKAYDKPLHEAQSGEISDADRDFVMDLLKNAGNIDKLERFAKSTQSGIRAL